MARIPKNADEIFSEISGDYRKVFGEELISIILYGSGAGPDYIPGKSDLNFLLTLTERGIERLDTALDTVAKWQKSGVAIPLLMTRSYLAGSLDAYPVEFLNMKQRYRVVYGEDVLLPLAFDPGHMRLQLERELRGKLLHLRGGYLATGGKAGRIRDLIGVSLTAFVSLFAALLFLKKMAIPDGKRDIITAAAVAVGFNATVFLKCEEIRRKADSFASAELQAVFRDYLQEVGHLCELIDRMDVES